MIRQWWSVLVLLLLLLHSLCRAIFLSWAPRLLYNWSPLHAGGSAHLWGHQGIFRRGLRPHTLICSIASPLSDQSLAACVPISMRVFTLPCSLDARFPSFPNVCGGARKWHLWQMERSIRKDGWSKVVPGQRSSSCAENCADVWLRHFLGCNFMSPCYLLALTRCLPVFFFCLQHPKTKWNRLIQSKLKPERFTYCIREEYN